MFLTISLNDEEFKLFKEYAKDRQISLDEYARDAILEKIFDDDADLAAYEKAFAEYKKNPTTYTHEEMKKMAGLK